ncbi:MAG: outer membrane protein assembly factor BamE [Planctomycetota bacterium]
MTWRKASAATALTITLSASLLGGCIYGSSVTRESGTRVNANTLGRIVPGETTSGWVMAALGEPTRRTTYDDGRELWVYSYSKEKKSKGTFLLVVGGSDTSETTQTAFVEFDAEGIVTETWRD